MVVELTDAEILCLHRWMWTDMQRDIGNNSRGHERTDYKSDWCAEHDLDICCNCFLCECAIQSRSDGIRNCDVCLVEWPMVDKNCYFTGFYLYADISDILKLPTKKFDPDRRTKINMHKCDIEELRRRMKCEVILQSLKEE